MTEHLNPIRRYLPLALTGVLLALCALAATAHAEEWGEMGHFHIPAGKGAKEVNFGVGANLLAFAVDSADRSYYVGDEPNAGEYRIQRFVEGKAEAAISFTPPEAKKSKDGVGEAAVGLQIAVDSARNRVYALVLYRRRNVSEKEEKEEAKEEKEKGKAYPRFPLDSEELTAGELYAFEYKEGQLVSAKVKEEKPAPFIGETTAETSTTAFADQSETAKEALLNPRGMAVDPATGNLAIVGVEDQEPDEKVEKEEAQKQCRAAGQFVILEEKSGKLKGGKLGHRYVDKADALRPEGLGCEAEEHQEVPLSPVITPGGNLLVYSGAETEGQIWEIPTPGSGEGSGEVEAHPSRLYGESQVGSLLNMEAPEEGAGPVMSFVPEGTKKARST